MGRSTSWEEGGGGGSRRHHTGLEAEQAPASAPAPDTDQRAKRRTEGMYGAVDGDRSARKLASELLGYPVDDAILAQLQQQGVDVHWHKPVRLAAPAARGEAAARPDEQHWGGAGQSSAVVVLAVSVRQAGTMIIITYPTTAVKLYQLYFFRVQSGCEAGLGSFSRSLSVVSG